MKKMNDEQRKEVHVSYIDQGTIKRDRVSELRKSKAIIRATFLKDELKQDTQGSEHEALSSSDSPMKTELLKKLQNQREKIQEEQKRCEKAKEAWIKQLEETRHTNKDKTQEEE